MSRTRMMGGEEPPQGAPSENAAELPPVPTGIQRLLRLAAIDDAFRQALVVHREDAAKAAQIPLTASEASILRAIDASLLEEMAAKMPAPPQAEGRRDFLRQSAATAVVLLGGAALSQGAAGCDSPQREDHNATMAVAGVAPDMPPESPPREDHNVTSAIAGVAPDMPPEKPTETASPPAPTSSSTQSAAASGAAVEPPPRPPSPPPRPKRIHKTAGISDDIPGSER